MQNNGRVGGEKMTQRVIYKITAWEDVKGGNPDLSNNLRKLLEALKAYGISEANIFQIVDLDMIQQQQQIPRSMPQQGGQQDD